MLDFIPLNGTATIYKQSGTVDTWGQPSFDSETYTAKCQINYNADLNKISGEDGVTTSMSATLVFHGLVDVRVGDNVEFSNALGVSGRYRIGDVYFFEDYAGKIVATRVVVSSGKRS